MTKRAVAIFAKPPIAGQTKSRLAAGTSPEFAAELSGAMLYDLAVEAVNTDADVILFYPPQSDLSAFGELNTLIPEHIQQTGYDLGERMFNCFDQLLNNRYDQVILIGSDCISHSTDGLTKAFVALSGHDMVIQPADDGGYVLIGMTTPHQGVFQNIDWGTDTVMQHTRKRVAASGLTCYELPSVFDVDTVDDLVPLRDFLKTHSHPRVKTVLDSFSLTQ